MKKDNIEGELSEIIEYCESVDSRMEKGIAVFSPDEKDKYLYDLLVLKGVMSKNPMGGYSMRSSANKIWGKIPTEFRSVPEEEYEDDDGVIQVFMNEKQEIEKVITEEDIMKGKKNGNG